MAEFLNEYKTDEWEVESNSIMEWHSFSGIGKTVPYKVWIIKTDGGRELQCADEHIVYKYGETPHTIEEVYIKDLKVGDLLFCRDTACEAVVSIEETDRIESMYDLTDVEGGNHYYTNGILSHNSTTVVSYVLHYLLFNPNVNVAILAHKQEISRELLGKLKTAYEYLPKWLQHGVVEWNKGSVHLENGSKVKASATSSSAIRGGSYNCVVLDEFAYVPVGIAEDFYSSAFPTISTGSDTKIMIFSTPNGLNMFYKIWTDAEEKRNSFVPISVHWSDLPGRDEKWRKQQIANSSEEQFRVEYNCVFEDTQITIRDIETGTIQTIPIGEFWNML